MKKSHAPQQVLGKTKSPMKDFPTEFLALVFKFTHEHSLTIVESTPDVRSQPGNVYRYKPSYLARQVEHSCMAQGPDRVDVQEHAVPSIFYILHDIRRVCKRWKSTIETTPEFHSRIVVDLDEKKGPLSSRLKKQLKKALDVPLDVFITRGSKDSDKDLTHSENATAATVMKILGPTIPQCRSFVVDVKYGTSLPLLSQYLRGSAEHLRILKLQCEIDDEDEDKDLPEVPKLASDLDLPVLSIVALDGVTFPDACRIQSFTDQFKYLSLDILSIGNLSVPVNEDFDLYTLLEHLCTFGYIRHLIVENILAGCDPGTIEGGEYQINVDCVTLIGHDLEFTEEFFLGNFGGTFCYWHIDGSGISENSVPMAHHLRLENIPDVPDNDWHGALTRYFGNRLDIIDCKDFSDEHLDIIANNCEPLRRLYLIDCPNITVKGLKVMITRREELIAVQDEEDDETEDEDDSADSDAESLIECTSDDDTLIGVGYEAFHGHWEDPRRTSPYRPIHRLCVKGHPTKKLSKVDQNWFKKRVKSFQWK